MSHVVEVDDAGALTVPAGVIGAEPHTRFRIEVQGDLVVLRREDEQPVRTGASDQTAAFRKWVASHRRGEGTGIPLDALRRENLYD